MSHNHKMITLPKLREKMREKQASRAALAKAAGCCETAVHKAMNGESVRLGIGNLLLQTLQEREFRYKRRMA